MGYIRINFHVDIEEKTGLFVGTSKQIPGLLTVSQSMDVVTEDIIKAVKDLFAAAVGFHAEIVACDNENNFYVRLYSV